MKGLNQGSCVFLMGIAVLIGYMSLQLGIGHLELMGAGFMPFLASIVLFSLSLSVFIMEMKGAEKEEKKSFPMQWSDLKNPILLVVGLIGYALILKTFGYLITTFLLMFFMFFMTGPQKWRKDIAIAVTIAILSYIIFDKWLRLPLPSGVFRIGW